VGAWCYPVGRWRKSESKDAIIEDPTLCELGKGNFPSFFQSVKSRGDKTEHPLALMQRLLFSGTTFLQQLNRETGTV
jgi:hypothetical protein